MLFLRLFVPASTSSPHSSLQHRLLCGIEFNLFTVDIGLVQSRSPNIVRYGVVTARGTYRLRSGPWFTVALVLPHSSSLLQRKTDTPLQQPDRVSNCWEHLTDSFLEANLAENDYLVSVSSNQA